jgi:hypothetical protein
MEVRVIVTYRLFKFYRRCGQSRTRAFTRALGTVLRDFNLNRSPR